MGIFRMHSDATTLPIPFSKASPGRSMPGRARQGSRIMDREGLPIIDRTIVAKKKDCIGNHSSRLRAFA